MTPEELNKLREKVDKDPNSKLFVPLAEEYRKTGRLDEAVNTLIKGLERQPGYASARVSLGKAYLEKGLKKQAQEEFEKVISAIPDNLYAHKKLAELYNESGDYNKSIARYKTVVRLNPFDDEASLSLNALLGRFQPDKGSEPSDAPAYGEVVIAGETEKTGKRPGEAQLSEIEEEPTSSLEELWEEEAKGKKVEPAPQAFESTSPGGIPDSGIQTETAGEALEEASPEGDALEFGDIQELSDSELTEAPDFMAEEPQAEIEEISEGGIEEIPAEDDAFEIDDIQEEYSAEFAEAEEFPAAKDEDSLVPFEFALPEAEVAEAIEAAAFSDEAFKVPDIVTAGEDMSLGAAEDEGSLRGRGKDRERLIPEQGQRLTELARIDFSAADDFVAKGNYFNALEAYRQMLNVEAANIHVRQRIVELKSLLKMLGKDKEMLILKLDKFLHSIKRGRDEFFRNA